MLTPNLPLSTYLRAHGARGEVVTAVSEAIREIAWYVERSAFEAVSSEDLGVNVHGEQQKPLDLLANELMLAALAECSHVAAVASEELTDLAMVPGGESAPYLVAVDPLDGSSNIEVNVGVGTIFSVLQRRVADAGPPCPPTESEFLGPAGDQVAAGFALFGPATVLVITLGDGTHGFTLDRDSGDFLLTHPSMRIADEGREYAINASNERFWELPVRRYVEECRAGSAGPRRVDYNTRWVASLVAEAYRILVRGGVFLYPADGRPPTRCGRLRSVYECRPIALLIEQAGGRASTGRGRVLDGAPESLHERTPFAFGASAEVERLERLHRAFDEAAEAAADGHVGALEAGVFDASLFNDRSLFRVS